MSAERELAEYAELTERQSDLLRRTVNILRGEPDELTRWSHHDIPELVAALKAENLELRRMFGGRDSADRDAFIDERLNARLANRS
jgi:hypothetical protein